MAAPTLPNVMPFEGVSPGSSRARDCFWRRVAHRKPKKGEWYVSGAIPMAYKAPNDLPFSYLVVEPTFFAKQVSVWQQGERVPTARRVRA